jgi:hypothetical protein
MSKIFIALLTVFCLTGCTSFWTTETKQEILLAKMEKAVDPEGIASAWKTVIIKMQLEAPAQQLKMSVTGLYKFPDKSKVVAVMPGIPTVTQVFNGRQAWKETAGLGIQMKTGIQLAFAKFECRKTNPAFKLTEIYEKITLDPALYKIGEFSCHKLICTLPVELKVASTQLFVDDKEFLIRRSIENQLTEMGVVPVILDFSDYKIVEGVKTPMLVNMNMMGIKMVGKLLSVKVNEKIADYEFQLPKDK